LRRAVCRAYAYGDGSAADFALLLRGNNMHETLQLSVPPKMAGALAGWLIGRLAQVDARIDVEPLRRAARLLDDGTAERFEVRERLKIRQE
jgi:hypothetical protein